VTRPGCFLRAPGEYEWRAPTDADHAAAVDLRAVIDPHPDVLVEREVRCVEMWIGGHENIVATHSADARIRSHAEPRDRACSRMHSGSVEVS
jgi:hypothetical protein